MLKTIPIPIIATGWEFVKELRFMLSRTADDGRVGIQVLRE
jgi:hypothetical protein